MKDETELEWWKHPTEKTKSKVGYVHMGNTILAIYGSPQGHDLVEWNLTTGNYKFIAQKVPLATAIRKMGALAPTTK